MELANGVDHDQIAFSGAVRLGREGWLKGVWSGIAKVLCILRHWGVQLILAYSWARLAKLVAGKGRGECFLFLLSLPFHSCSSFFPVLLFHLLYFLFCLFSPFLWETTQNDPQGLTCHLTPTQSLIWVCTICKCHFCQILWCKEF